MIDETIEQPLHYINRIFQLQDTKLNIALKLDGDCLLHIRIHEYQPDYDMYLCRIEQPYRLSGVEVTLDGHQTRSHLTHKH